MVGALGGGEITLDVLVELVIVAGPVGYGYCEELGGGGVELTLEAEEMPLGEGGASDEALGDVVGGGVLEMPLGEGASRSAWDSVGKRRMVEVMP